MSQGHIFLYEYACAIGPESQLPESICIEGRAMRDALAEDLVRAGWEVILLDHVSGTEEYHHFEQCLRKADAAWIIAPEIDRILVTRCQWVEAAGVPLLGTSSETLSWLTDKWQQFLILRQNGVPVPPSTLEPPGDLDMTYIRKPRYGAGACDIQIWPSAWAPPQVTPMRSEHTTSSFGTVPNYLWQRYVPGQAASIACLCGPGQQVLLRAAAQRIDPENNFRYCGGYLPLPAPLELRTKRLAKLALAALPSLRGYIGMDLVLGPSPDGSEDYIIEINPRLTTSYLGQRALCEQNLAELALAIIKGRTVDEPSWRDGGIRFDTQGNIYPC
ncbi:MAG: ATP-grasp domain-containing protein [Gemmatales bacterium]|nr:ATP-grasp domain-containing protein [Gemmatales bacterium]MDW8176728.1 ATP-grasp domain-containing protein [Gemmatales bacterium]MDW8221912.1 ATP-grasp domain-containing protein [Gemmatales bacterium]